MPYDNNPTAKMGPYHMESAKQEKENLIDDNPVARTAAGDRPWIAKHYKSDMNYGTPAMKLKGDQVKLDKNKNNKIDAEDFKMMKSNSDINMDHK